MASASRKCLFPEGGSAFLLHKREGKYHLLLNHPIWLVAPLPEAARAEYLVDGNTWQVNILHHGPDNGQTRGLSRKGINLISALVDIAKEALNHGVILAVAFAAHAHLNMKLGQH